MCPSDEENLAKVALKQIREYNNALLRTDKPKRKRKITLTPSTGVKVQLKKLNEINRHIDNIRMVMANSNATPIRCHTGLGFKCCFCPRQFVQPADLKQHTLAEHDDKTKSTFMGRTTMVRYIVKLDITSLKCSVCNSDMPNLIQLIEHLVYVHGKTYNYEIKNHIIPFRFEGETHKCVMCDTEFNHFKLILEHMNVHFSNHVCEVCGCGFINKHTLQCHSYRHKTGEFKCAHCTKIFDTNVKRRDHERSVHIKASLTNKCNYCEEKFTDYRKKRQHETRDHGAKPLLLRCQTCREIFTDQAILTAHIKSTHALAKRIHHLPSSPKRKSPSEKSSSEQQRGEVLEKHRTTVRQILLFTNATPIRTRTGKGYTCSFCPEQYPDPKDLKKHTIEKHKAKEKASFMKGKELRQFYVKMDITDLKCTICEQEMSTVDDIMNHLSENHQKAVYSEVKSQILPFTFEGEGLKCCLCNYGVPNFKVLVGHMNRHYRNFICEVCDAGFVCQSILSQHSRTHKLGTFKCEFCPKVYETRQKKRAHERLMHIQSALLHKCGFCSETFKSYWMREKHLASEHGVGSVYKCKCCEKTFQHQKDLWNHTKRNHLMDRPHACTQCDMRFYLKTELTDHMVKHTGLREFQCEICLKSYGHKKTLTWHMRSHGDFRKYKCEHCGRGFVHRESLVKHMRSKHEDKFLEKE